VTYYTKILAKSFKIKFNPPNEEIRHHKKYIGKRISRGLFRTSNGTLINADVNAGYNIMKKVFPNSVKVDGIEAFGLMPQVIYQNIFDTII